jgi:DNA (cytosine-5)-methyltransferase 1
MSWLYSQALVEEYLGDISLDGEQSVQSSGSNTQQAYCAPDKMTKFSRLSRFGMTYKPLTDNLGEELLTLFRADFHAKTSQLRGEELELMENDQECGEKWRGSFVKFDPDTHLWKTHQCSLLGDLDEFLETWPQWGLMRDGECWEQQTLAQTIRGTGYGLSPNGMDSFHTPNTTGLDGGSNSRKALKQRLEKLPTPQASDHITKKTSASWKAKGGVNFSLSNPEIQMKWPTPIASRGGAWRGDGQVSMIARNVETYEEYWLLTQGTSKKKREKYWPTPRASDFKGATSAEAMSKAAARGFNPNLPEATAASVGGGQLNPTWVEWLMGWPLGWTDLKPLETDKSHSVQQPLGES